MLVLSKKNTPNAHVPGIQPWQTLNQNKTRQMKKLAIIAMAGFATSAFAGTPMVSSGKKTVTPPEACFAETELQLDVYAAYSSSDGDHGDGFGGGLGINYFFQRYFGIGVDTTLTDGDTSAVWQISGSLIGRYPIELGSVCLAPYVKVGGGLQVDGGPEGYISTGGGLEFRVTPRLGIFGEGSYNFSEGENDFAQARLGMRFVF
jgi:hypothetical protein